MADSFLKRLVTGFKAFREAYTTSGLQDIEQEFTSFEARRLRYEMYWAFYESTIYRNIHKWSVRMKVDYGLYRWIRAIYNPSFRIGEFWKSHIWGGFLDPEAGDGKFKPSAIPIRVPKSNVNMENALRMAISQAWLDSNFAVNKDIWTLHGAVLGDLPMMVVDDVERGKVYIDAIHPGTLQEVTLDDRGNVKGYILAERRRDPENSNRVVTYNEVAKRDGDGVVYQTYRDGQPYDWSGNGEEWSVGYGFIPMVLIRHIDVGLDWGWSELHPGRFKFMELDDLASKTHDHIRKNVDPPWFFSGVSKSKSQNTIKRTREDPTEDRPEPEREQIPAIYATNPQAKATPLVVSDLDLEAVNSALGNLFSELEKDYPELQWDERAAIQTNSSRAIRVARQKVENKVIQRRETYDNGLKRILQMAMSIGAMRKYNGYTDISPDSYGRDELQFFIDNRPVFGKDPLDELEIEEKLWTVAKVAVPYLGLDYFLERHGWSEDDRKKAVAAHEEMSAQREAQNALQNQPQGADRGAGQEEG